MFQSPLLILNQDTQAAQGATFDRLNPITGAVATRAAAASAADAAAACDAAASAFPEWSRTSPSAQR